MQAEARARAELPDGDAASGSAAAQARSNFEVTVSESRVANARLAAFEHQITALSVEIERRAEVAGCGACAALSAELTTAECSFADRLFGQLAGAEAKLLAELCKTQDLQQRFDDLLVARDGVEGERGDLAARLVAKEAAFADQAKALEGARQQVASERASLKRTREQLQAAEAETQAAKSAARDLAYQAADAKANAKVRER